MKAVKQVIVWRNDLKDVPLGKKMGQAAHAAHLFLTNKFKSNVTDDGSGSIAVEPEEAMWMNGEYKKVVVIVRSLEEFNTIKAKAVELGLRTNVVTDAGHTVFAEPTVTCMALGPNYEDEIDLVTGPSGPLGRLRLA